MPIRPVFICGCDRSGTTFLGSLLGSHSRSVATLESHFVYELYRHAFTRDRFDLDAALSRLRNSFRFRLWNLELRTKEIRARGVQTYTDLIEYVISEYARAVGRGEADFWIDHTPHNREHAVYLSQLFPEAKFIHIVRDGRAVAASFKTLPWRHHSAVKIARYWVEKVGQGLAAESYIGPADAMRVRYEDLVTDPESTVRQLATFIGLTYEPQMLDGGGFAPPKLTATQHALVGQRASRQRINAWEKKLSAREVEVFESSTADMLAYLGYPLKYGVLARGQTRGERYRDRFVDVFYYRRIDGFEERIQRKETLAQLARDGYLNPVPSSLLAGPPKLKALNVKLKMEPTLREISHQAGQGFSQEPSHSTDQKPQDSRVDPRRSF